MAITKVKRSVHKKQSTPTKAAPGNNRRASNPSVILNNPQSVAKDPGALSRAGARKARILVGKPAERRTLKPGSLALLEKNLPGRRFVEFPQVKGKTIEKVEMFTTGEYHCITLDLQDHTTLNLGIEPGFTINAELQQIEKGEVQVLAEWPPIKSSN